MGIQPSARATRSAKLRGPVPTPSQTGGRGCCSGLGKAWLGPNDDVLARVLGGVVAPQRLDRRELVAHDRAPLGVGDAVVLDLLDVPAVPDAEREAAAGDQVQRRDLPWR